MRGARGTALAAALALAALAAAAQAPPGPEAAPGERPALRRFLEQSGALLVRRTWSLGGVPLEGGARLRLEAVSAHQPGAEHLRALGIALRLEPALAGAAEGPRYADLGEVDALVRGMRRIDRTLGGDEDGAGADRTELVVETRDGFGVDGVLEGGARRRHVRWGERRIGIGAEAFESLREALDAGRRELLSG